MSLYLLATKTAIALAGALHRLTNEEISGWHNSPERLEIYHVLESGTQPLMFAHSQEDEVYQVLYIAAWVKYLKRVRSGTDASSPK